MMNGKPGAWLMKGAMLVCMCSFLVAGEPVKTRQNQQTADAPKLETLYTVKDAATGKMRPMTAQERDAAGLPALLHRSDAPAPRLKGKNGSYFYKFNGGYQNALMIKKNPDGTFEQACVDSAEAAAAFVAKKPKEETSHVR